jgi:hypothetical protein
MERKLENNMNRMTASLFLATALLPMAAIGAPASGVCSTGAFLDVQVSDTMIQIGTTEHAQQSVKKNGKKEYNSYSTTNLQKQTIYTVTVRLDDVVYTAQAESIFGFGFKPTLFIVNDSIKGCVRGNTLALARPDGKEYKTHIVRAARVQ